MNINKPTYQEIHIPNDGKTTPTFPVLCPVCDEPIESLENKGSSVACSVTYKCGGRYTYKEQFQNHTEKYWGKCGKAQDAN